MTYKMKLARELIQLIGSSYLTADRVPPILRLAKQLARLVLDAKNNEPALVEALREIVEIYTGMDGFIAETAPEGYQQRIIRQMYETARDTLNKLGYEVK